MIFPCMKLFLVIFQVFHDFQSLWEPCVWAVANPEGPFIHLNPLSRHPGFTPDGTVLEILVLIAYALIYPVELETYILVCVCLCIRVLQVLASLARALAACTVFSTKLSCIGLYGPHQEKTCFRGFPKRSYPNQPAQLQRQVRKLKFCL